MELSTLQLPFLRRIGFQNKKGKAPSLIDFVPTPSMAAIGSSYETDASVSKYYAQRYRIWQRFDDGIYMTKEGWFSVTMEPIARQQAAHLAALVSAGGTSEPAVVVDLFCGCGGNAIPLASHFTTVVGIDTNHDALEAAKKNSSVYGVAGKVRLTCCDVRDIGRGSLEIESADAVFMSPPWGGEDYSHSAYFDTEVDLQAACGIPLSRLLELAVDRFHPSVIGIFLPRNVLVHDLASAGLRQGFVSLEFEVHRCNERIKGVTVYFSQRTSEPRSNICDIPASTSHSAQIAPRFKPLSGCYSQKRNREDTDVQPV